MQKVKKIPGANGGWEMGGDTSEEGFSEVYKTCKKKIISAKKEVARRNR